MCDKKPVSLTKPEPGMALICKGCIIDSQELMKINNPYFTGNKKTKVVKVKMINGDFKVV